MLKFSKLPTYIFAVLIFFTANVCAGAAELDRSRYIGIDEITPGMKAYCLTVFKGTQIERFDFEVLSVVRNIEPKRNAIMVRGIDERFIHAGMVAGCSGSPVYIDGRLAGALAFGWSFSKDPLYGVTPIEEMLAVGTAGDGGHARQPVIDLSGSIDLQRIEKQYISSLHRQSQMRSSSNALAMPVMISGIPDSAVGEFENLFGPVTAAGPSGSVQAGEDVELSPGGVLTVPLITGDIDISVLGTVTEVDGENVYAFGHSFLGYGPVELPMATGQVHTIVANLMRSFKLGSPGEIVGTLFADETSAVRGRIGTVPPMIPMTINVSRFNTPQPVTYQCSIANDDYLTPILVRIALAGAANQRGELPPEHTLRYRTTIEIEGEESISFENVSVNSRVAELLTETMVPVALIMNNPYRQGEIKSIRCDMEELDRAMLADIKSVEIYDNKVEQGERFSVEAVIEPMRSQKKKYTFDFTVPKDLKPGEYDVFVLGGAEYLEFLISAAKQRFIAENYETLISALNNILSVRRDRLYCVFMLPESGVTLERAELPDLPMTQVLVLTDSTRTTDAQPYRHWIEKSVRTPQVIRGAGQMKIEVVR
ncbi:MAG: SpoIVB peptidase S55 domain-containing protein [Phycisphaerae bacterium]|jgi:hypothetical protein